MENISNQIGSSSLGLGARDYFENDAELQDKPTTTLLNETAVLVEGEISTQDDAEEISVYMSNSEKKPASERKVKSETLPEVMDLQVIEALLEKSKDPDLAAKLAKLSRLLLEGNAKPRETLSKEFSGVTQQYLALQYALRQGEQENASSETLENLREALADLEMESGPQIRAGLNTIDIAHDFGDDQQSFDTFQTTYQDIVLGENTLAKALDIAVERFGGKDVTRGLKQMVAAIGLDIGASKPSIDRNRLHALTQDMFFLETAATVLERCHTLGEKIGNLH